MYEVWNDAFYIFISAKSVKTVKTDDNANVTTDQKSSFNEYDEDSEFSSELEEVYEQFSKWLEDPIIKENVEKLDPRDEAVLSFASSLLKRTLSESFVGVPLTDGCISSTCKQFKIWIKKWVCKFIVMWRIRFVQVFRRKKIPCKAIRTNRRIVKL